MTSSLRDALRQSGALDQFKPVEGRDGPADRQRRNPASRGEDRRGAKPKNPANARPGHPPGKRPADRSRTGEEIDLAKAYALRAQSEQRERERKEAAEREIAERRRAQREQVVAMLEGKTLNRDDADTPRHFEYGGKIRRVYVDENQLAQVNDGRLGVIQLRGRYLLVDRALAESIRGIDVNAVALLVDPDEIAGADDQPAANAATP